MELYKKIIVIIIVSTVLSFLTYKGCYFISEKYFFEKLIYQKSIDYGYSTDNVPPTSPRYGRRSRDLALLKNSPSNNVLGAKSPSSFEILIIGDSYTWGSGIKNSDRYANLIDKKLNQLKRTKVFTLAIPGWNILDYRTVYQKVSENNLNPDLTIIGGVANDILIRHQHDKHEFTTDCQNQFPTEQPIYELNYPEDRDKSATDDEFYQKVNNSILKAWQNPVNTCVFEKSISSLPDQIIYFITDDYYGQNESFAFYKKYLSKNNKFFLSSQTGKNIPIYSEYFTSPGLFYKFQVSNLEGHPNALANRMYADILFNEITTNPKWNFIKK